MTKLTVYSVKGIKKGSTNMPSNLVEKENLALLAQAMRVYENRSHPGLAKTKTRGEVRASTRKIYRQKGTGYARHGAISAPIFVGGGDAHGPRGERRRLNLPIRMKNKALRVALTLKAKEGMLFVIDGFSTIKKTKEMAGLLNKIAEKEEKVLPKSHFTVVLADANKSAEKGVKNIKNLKVNFFRNLNAQEVFWGGVILLDKEALNLKKEQEKTPVTKSVSVGKTESAGKVKKVAVNKTSKAKKTK